MYLSEVLSFMIDIIYLTYSDTWFQQGVFCAVTPHFFMSFLYYSFYKTQLVSMRAIDQIFYIGPSLSFFLES